MWQPNPNQRSLSDRVQSTPTGVELLGLRTRPTITAISTWRCKCGAPLKVVGECPKDKPSASQTAACPKCGNTQTVFGETILSIVIEEDALR